MRAYNSLLFLLFSLLSFEASAQKKVLFIGNSYTHYHSMPSLFEQVALSAGDSAYTESHTPGGRRISQHASDPKVYDLIRGNTWDYVVIQCQSQEASFSDGQVARDVLPYAKALCDSIRKINTCTIPLFYMTWGRKNGDASNCANWPPVCTYEGMDSIIHANYVKMGKLNQAEVAPVGGVWRRLRTNTPTLDLYSSDGSHPSLNGAVAAAYTFYSTIFKRSPYDASYTANLSSSVIDSIKSAVEHVFYSNQSKFIYSVGGPPADFTYQQTWCTVAFTQTTKDPTFLHKWNFGDGARANWIDPSYTYRRTGTFTVTLEITDHCGRSQKDSTTVKMYCTSGINDTPSAVVFVPNPNTGVIELADDYRLTKVYNSSGQEIKYTDNGDSSYTIDPNFKGFIFLNIANHQGYVTRHKILLK